MSSTIDKMQLVDIVKAYKSRTYDEDLNAVEELGGKCCTIN